MLKLKIYEWIVLALTLLAVAGFFLPWIKVNVLPSRTLERLAAEVARQLRGDEDVSFRDLLVMSRQQKQAAMDDPLKGMSGLDLPGQVNRGNAEGLMARLALQTFFGSKGVEQKALLVYFYPVLAVVAFLMLLTVRQNRRLFLIPAVLILALY
ncbi:hypothetical protein QQ054_00305, partial [Oscillatoria amoena NRMC-F 0135]|nr:hypothetical protein [Oscillatoria amoena NRMC-F 0135]